MRYKTKSADVLNAADRFENILNWQLFCLDQEQLLYGHNPDVEWVPGDFLHKHPKARFTDEVEAVLDSQEDVSEEELEWLYEEGPLGNCVRPMFQTFEYAGPGESCLDYSVYQKVRAYWSVLCEPCGVSWSIWVDQHCWNCGTEFEKPEKPKRLSFSNHNAPRVLDMSQFRVSESRMEADGLHVTFSVDVDWESFRAIWERSMRSFSIGMQQAGAAMQESARAFRGLGFDRQYIDEAHSFDRVMIYSDEDVRLSQSLWQRANPGYVPSRPQPTPPPNPFEREEREIVLVESRIAEHIVDPPWSYGYVRLPREVDLSGRRAPMLPQMPEPEVPLFPDVRSGPPTTPATERRRGA